MQRRIDSPVGSLVVVARGDQIIAMNWGQAGDDRSPVLDAAADQLDGYFQGRLTQFDLPLSPGGTEFQRAFYDALCAIPFGQTRTYGELAGQLGVSAQAIGQACGANPIPILIPCHRVLAANGLGGYSGRGGVEAKIALLKLEGAASLLI